jgi:hypothetical protein
MTLTLYLYPGQGLRVVNCLIRNTPLFQEVSIARHSQYEKLSEKALYERD